MLKHAASGKRFVLKGTNWFGLETADFCLHGLWSVPMAQLLDFLKQHRFNALRVPFSAEFALDMDGCKPTNCNYHANPELQGKSSGQMMDALIQGCADRGIVVLLDMHRLHGAGEITELWYQEGVSGMCEARAIQAWQTIVARYKECWNVVGADLKNEPHGQATWGTNSNRCDWRLAAERLGNAVLKANRRLLIFVEGVEGNVSAAPGKMSWWGGHLGGAKADPVRLSNPRKLVYSPHVYGPDVYEQPYFQERIFPRNMPEIWEEHFGFIKARRLGPAVVVGEWGGHGREGSKDRLWQQVFGDWLAATDHVDTFYWCLNPNSGDTGGLLADDWATPNEFKLNLLQRVCPNPSIAPRTTEALIITPVPSPAPPVNAKLYGPPSAPPSAPSSEISADSEMSAATTTTAPAFAPAAAAPPPPLVARPNTPAVPHHVASGLKLKSLVESTWQEGDTPVALHRCELINASRALAADITIQIGGNGRVQHIWNVEPKPMEDAVYGLPRWADARGGLEPNEVLQFGFTYRGTAPPLINVAIAGRYPVSF